MELFSRNVGVRPIAASRREASPVSGHPCRKVAVHRLMAGGFPVASGPEAASLKGLPIFAFD
jgi:hypothetical protein